MRDGLVNLQITTTMFSDADTQPDVIKTVCTAKQKNTDEGVIFEYDEDKTSGMGSTHTTLKISTDHKTVTVCRTGDTATVLTFEKNKRAYVKYATQYGQFELELNTQSLTINKTDGYNIQIDYSIKTDDADVLYKMIIDTGSVS